MAAAIAMRLVPMRLVPRAMSIVFTGVSIATVCAAPVGAYVGDMWGWRAAFVIAAAVGAVALIVQMLTMPKLPPVAVSSFRTLFELLKRPNLGSGWSLRSWWSISGHFAGFTYVRPFLEQVPALEIEAISLVLLAYGIGGFFGNFAGAFVVERSVRAAVILGSLFIASWRLPWSPLGLRAYCRRGRCALGLCLRVPAGRLSDLDGSRRARSGRGRRRPAGDRVPGRHHVRRESSAGCSSTASGPSAPSPMPAWRRCSAR